MTCFWAHLIANSCCRHLLRHIGLSNMHRTHLWFILWLCWANLELLGGAHNLSWPISWIKASSFKPSVTKTCNFVLTQPSKSSIYPISFTRPGSSRGMLFRHCYKGDARWNHLLRSINSLPWWWPPNRWVSWSEIERSNHSISRTYTRFPPQPQLSHVDWHDTLMTPVL